MTETDITVNINTSYLHKSCTGHKKWVQRLESQDEFTDLLVLISVLASSKL